MNSLASAPTHLPLQHWLQQTEQQQALEQVQLSPQDILTQADRAAASCRVKLLNAMLREGLAQRQQNRLSLAGQQFQLQDFNTDTQDQLRHCAVILDHQQQPVSLTRLFGLLIDHSSPQRIAQLSDSLRQSLFNSTLALAWRTRWGQQLQQQGQPGASFWQWLTTVPLHQHYSLLEQWAAIGHPSHPIDRSKPQLSLTEILQYSPDFEGGAALQLAALARSALQQESDRGLDALEYWQQNFPALTTQWQAALTKEGLNPASYLPIPLHPWQRNNILPQRFAAQLQSRQLVILSGLEIPSRASLSFRTMLPEQPGTPYLKVPVAIHMTSAVRLLSTRSAHMGPRMSRLLGQLLERFSTLKDHFGFMAETLGVHYHNTEQPDDQLAANLSYLCRENLACQVADDEVAIPGAALLSETPAGNPLWVELLQQQGQDSPAGAQQLLARFAHICCQGPLQLYLLTGLGLEVHQQNSVLVFSKDGQLKRLIARDFGAFRIYRARFEQTGCELVVHHDRRLICDDARSARNRLVHSLLISQLGELIRAISQYYGCPDAPLWLEVRHAIEQLGQQLQGQVEEDWLQQELHGFIHDNWQMKALLTMMLTEDDSYHYTELTNPLSRCDAR